MGEHADFQNLLVQLQSTDNELRTQAEAAYDAIPSSSRFTLLLQTISDKSVPSQSRHMAAILGRRLLVNDYTSAFEALPDETKVAAKQQLLLGVVHETENIMRRKIADLAAELARMQYDDDGNSEWPEFLQFLLECSNSTDIGLREVACHLFAAVPSVFGSQQASSLPIIGQFLGRAIADPSHYELRASGVRALAAFIAQNATENSVLQALKELVPMTLQAISNAIEADPDDDVMLKALVDIADAAYKYLRPYLNAVLELCYKIVRNEELVEPQRHLALEVIVTLAENGPAGVCRSAAIIESLVGTLLKLMTEMEEANWDEADTMEEEDDSSNALTAERDLDRLSCALGGQHVLNEIIRTVPGMLQNADWKQRYAGLMAISACSEGSSKLMETMLGSVLEAVVPRLADPHPRVRYAACNSVGQMASDFGPKLQKNHHSIVLPALVQVLDDAVPRVQANAGAALVNFCEKVPQHILTNYLEGLVAKLEQIMNAKFQEMVQHGRKLVLMQIVTTVAAVADAAEKRFSPYYDRFMPILKYIMENALHKELRLLRGKTIECISLIGLAVGKEKFINDVGPVMNLLMATQTQNESDASGDDDDSQASYMISAWARICKLLGRDFESYLPIVMPQVLKSACIKPEICILDNDEADTVESDLDWQVVKLGEDRNYAIRTSGLEDKATACQMLVCYAREMKESFAPYCQQVLDIMVPLLDFYFNDEVRSAAAECLPYLLGSLKARQPEAVVAAWTRVHKALLRAITSEPERDVVAEHLLALAGSIEAVGKECVTSEQLNEVRGLLDRLFHEHFEKSDERVAKRNDEDFDEYEEERLMTEKDEDEYVLSKMCDVVHAVFVTFGEGALPFFQQLIVFCVKLLEPGRPWSDLQWGICLWDDVIEFGGTQSWQFHEFFLPTFMQAVHHQQPDVRQAVVYGIGVAAMHGGPEYNAVLSNFVAPLIQLIEAPDAKSSDNNLCTENAISAITKVSNFLLRLFLFLFHQNTIPLNHPYGKQSMTSRVRGSLLLDIGMPMEFHLRGVWKECF
ncbi:Karyopherin (importin) beta 3 [Fasciolopsis buskii]|uniref:Karyopherin (Importin) beta 3 n=1 Tax=Fasciolopsis buskii TaxID=27845 RepID=A0A8E0S3F2_9TREM|nr:Karyopherin (importin) beta 3 [Fasciolopsis buski]